MQISDLHIGEAYTNREIVEVFKCGNMGGMRRSKQTNTLVLIAKYDNCYRKNRWDEQTKTLNFMGMGKIGDQSLTYAQNRTLAESGTNGVKVYLFETFDVGVYQYCGEVMLAAQPFEASEPGADGKMRKVIMFPLRRLD